ncbi:MAG: DNA recombination protein RmuC [Nitrospirota bacterium]
MIDILLIILIVLSAIILWFAYKGSTREDTSNFDKIRGYFDGNLVRLEASLKDEFSRNREELNKNFKESREELINGFKVFEDSILKRITEIATLQKNQLDTFSTQLTTLIKTNEEKLGDMTQTIEKRLTHSQEQINSNEKENREELSRSLKSFEERFSLNVKDFNELQKQKFDNLINRQTDLNQTTEKRLEKMRETIEFSLKSIQEDSSRKLEKMRETVDEKLHKTLEKRLGESFKIVSERLELVHKGLGEMQSLATGVGDLKKVLTNVKTRGVLGEYQLENILEQLLTADQYSKNVKTKKNSDLFVEFAVKLPGREDRDKVVWMPIDSKFPIEDYHSLMDAYDQANPELIESAQKQLANRIKLFAKDIRDKYIDPPDTTDFAIMFLPVEGLYAEVLRHTGLFEIIQRKFKVIITGPTTLSAILNSLQMGFRTLAIEKRSSEVWEILGAVKTEFGKFGSILEKTQKKLQEASNVIETAGVRTRAIERKLRNVQELPSDDAIKLLGEGFDKSGVGG